MRWNILEKMKVSEMGETKEAERVEEKRNQGKKERRKKWQKRRRGWFLCAIQNELAPPEAASGTPGEGTGLRVDCKLLSSCFAQSKVKGHLQNQISIRGS